MTKKLGRLLGLLIVTTLAVVVAIWASVSSRSAADPSTSLTANVAPPATPVSIIDLRRETIEIIDIYSGMINPFERFSLGFEIAGRIDQLGLNVEGQPLDDGDRVRKGQVLAELDRRVYEAQRKEAAARVENARARISEVKAQLEQAQANMRRANELRERGIRAITDTEYQEYVTDLAVIKAQGKQSVAQWEQAKAQLATAEKNLEDTRLLAPASGVIAKRLINAGESVTPNAPIMEIIQVDDVLLVVGVPEAYVSQIRVDQPVHVELLAKDRFRRKRPSTEGRVYQVAEAADQTTGLFEVEIRLANPNGQWRPGLIALGHIVIDRVEGFKIPTTCAVFRDDQTFVYTLDGQKKARRVKLGNWIEQSGYLVVTDMPGTRYTMVRRGQHRLMEGRAAVKIVRSDEATDADSFAPPSARMAESQP